MSKKNETSLLILSLLITVLLLGAGGWWFFSRFKTGNSSLTPGMAPSPTAGTPTGNSPAPSPLSSTQIDVRLSRGERSLFTEGASAAKQAGVEAIATSRFDQAVASLEASLKANPNDPEALIYLNNARIGNTTAYTIAVAVPTVTSANPALEILRGVAQAQLEINQTGGIKGIPLKVLIANDDNVPDVAQQIAATLVADSSVLGVIGHFGSDATLAGAPIYQQGGLAMISPTSTSVQLSGLGNYVFRTVPSDRFTATALARYMLNTLNKRNAVVYFSSASSYSNSLRNEFSTALATEGGQIVTEVDLAAPTFDAAATVKQANQQGAEVLVLLANTATLDPALQVAAVNRGQLQLLGGDSLYNPKTLQVGGEAVKGMVVAVPWVLLSNAEAPFARASRQLWGGDVNWRTAMAYDAAQVLIAGLDRNPTRTGIDEALRATDFSINGATGAIRFLPSGDRNQPMQLVIVEPGRRSGYGYDFIPAP